MPKKYTHWLIRKMRGIKLFTILMILLGVPAFIYLPLDRWLDPEYMLVYYFFYMFAWLFIHTVLQWILKPGMVRDYRRLYVLSHPELPEEFKEAILRGKVILGMDAEMASAATGLVYRNLPTDDGVTRVTSQEKYVKGSQL